MSKNRKTVKTTELTIQEAMCAARRGCRVSRHGSPFMPPLRFTAWDRHGESIHGLTDEDGTPYYLNFDDICGDDWDIVVEPKHTLQRCSSCGAPARSMLSERLGYFYYSCESHHCFRTPDCNDEDTARELWNKMMSESEDK